MLKMLPFQKQLVYNKAVYMYKVFNENVPSDIITLFQKGLHSYRSQNFILPLSRIDLYKTSFAFSGASVWNALPTSIKNIRTLRNFKKGLFQYLYE